MKLIAGGYLAFYMPQRKHTLEVRLGVPRLLTAILKELNIPLAEVHLTALNGEQVDLEGAVISDQDVVHIYSSVDGG